LGNLFSSWSIKNVLQNYMYMKAVHLQVVAFLFSLAEFLGSLQQKGFFCSKWRFSTHGFTACPTLSEQIVFDFLHKPAAK